MDPTFSSSPSGTPKMRILPLLFLSSNFAICRCIVVADCVTWPSVLFMFNLASSMSLTLCSTADILLFAAYMSALIAVSSSSILSVVFLVDRASSCTSAILFNMVSRVLLMSGFCLSGDPGTSFLFFFGGCCALLSLPLPLPLISAASLLACRAQNLTSLLRLHGRSDLSAELFAFLVPITLLTLALTDATVCSF